MKKLKLKIITPEKVLLEEEIAQVSVSTALGQVTILPNHLPMVAQLSPGEIIVKKDGQTEDLMAVSGGLLEVLPDQVVILADTAERAQDIDETRAEAARQQAEEILKTKITDAKQFALFTAKIEKELARLRVVRKNKNRKTGFDNLRKE